MSFFGEAVEAGLVAVAIPLKIYEVGVASRPHSRVVWYNLAQTEQIVSVKKPRAKGKTY